MGCCCSALGALRGPRRDQAGTAAVAPGAEPDVSLIVAAHAEEAVIAAKVANALRARLPARPARADRRLRRLARRHRPPGPRGRRRRRARAAARRQDPRPGRGRPRGARRHRSRSPTPTRCGSRARCGRSPRRSPIRRSATSAARSRSSTTAAPTRRASTGATRWRSARRESRAGIGHRRQRRDLRDAPRGLHRGRPGHGPRPVVPVQHGQARLARASTRPPRARPRRWSRRSRASSPASGG